MTMKRTTVFAEQDDLASLRDAARRLGVAEAVLLREAIHRAAMAVRRWDEPFFTPLPADEVEHLSGDDAARQGVEHVRADQAAAYEATKVRRR